MSTPIKNTLYRFVTLRSPELIDKDKENEYFVHHPEASGRPENGYESSYLEALHEIPTNKTKRQVLYETTSALTTGAWKSKKAVSEALSNDDLIEFATWLSKNRAKITPEMVKDKEESFENLVGITDSMIKITLWDNLFYQINTSQSFIVRDLLLSILVADHFLQKKEGHKFLRKLALSRVIIPSHIFLPSATEVNSLARKVNKKDAVMDSVGDMKSIHRSIFEKQIRSFEEILLELEASEKRYKKNEVLSKTKYDAGYNSAVQRAYANATKIEKSYTNSVTGEVVTYYEYQNLNLPAYEYQPVNEIDFIEEDDYTKEILLRFVNSSRQKYGLDYYDELKEKAREWINLLSVELLKNTTEDQKVIVTSGGALSISNSQRINRQAGIVVLTLNPHADKTYSVTAHVSGLEEGTQVVSGAYKISINQEPIAEVGSLSVISSPNGNSMINIELFTGQNVLQNLSEGFYNFDGEFKTSSGRTLLISSQGGILPYTNYSQSTGDDSVDSPFLSQTIMDAYGNLGGVTYLQMKGRGTYEYEDVAVVDEDTTTTQPNTGSTTHTNSSTPTVIAYIPSGYGIKRLGIADYRRVEQEVCCYVPGEVSHIENIMAREYKEKSTRRMRRQEDTVTSSTERETEQMTDTSTTDRFEMNQEVSSVLAQQNSFTGGAQMSWGGKISGSVHADYAHNTTKEESDLLSLAEAQEITERVLERVVRKVKEERISKIIEEFEENNKHGFDNRKGDKHVSGVYRWVDKIMKNRIINYGKRLMYEFMIPEPASFHNLIMEAKKNAPTVEILEKPIDPRKAAPSIALKIDDTFETRCQHWIEAYGVEVEEFKSPTVKVSKSFKVDFLDHGQEGNALNEFVEIPEGYIVQTAKVAGSFYHHGDSESGDNNKRLSIAIGNSVLTELNQNQTTFERSVNSIETINGKLAVSASSFDTLTVSFNVVAICALTPNALKKWRIDTFNAIIAAYESKLAAYNDKVNELKQAEAAKVSTNPMYNRQIENLVLRKNCIEYLIGHQNLGKLSMLQGATYSDTRAQYDSPALEDYANLVKFFEQAFEWDMMSYFFYPFYWAERN